MSCDKDNPTWQNFGRKSLSLPPIYHLMLHDTSEVNVQSSLEEDGEYFVE